TPHFVNRWTQCATLITITAGTFGVSEALRGPTPLFWLLSAVYLALLTGGVYALERSPGRVELSLYFVSSSALLIGLLYMSRASAWLMGLPLLSHMALFLPWQLALLWGTAFLGVLLLLANVPSKDLATATANTGAAILFVLAFSVMARRQAQWRLRAEALSASLQSTNARLRLLALEAEELSAMRERNRLAREVHDGLGHYLTTIHVQLEA